ncbi:hypothetical protein MRB53_038810 [Persea americana]|nr:hypothetical protein MRB53_038810 [Persea americana]
MREARPRQRETSYSFDMPDLADRGYGQSMSSQSLLGRRQRGVLGVAVPDAINCDHRAKTAGENTDA